DTDLTSKLDAASRAIDRATGRQFGQGASATQRYYDGCNVERLDGRMAMPVFDFATTTGLEVDLDLDGDGVYETALTYGTDFDVWPWSAQAEGEPWSDLRVGPARV